jgi:hypothetical protein
MPRIKSKLAPGFIFCLFCLTGWSQKLTQFSSDTAKFTRDLSGYFLENSANKDQAADYIRGFEKMWKENVIAGYFKEIIINTSNTMLAKRMKPHPFFLRLPQYRCQCHSIGTNGREL